MATQGELDDINRAIAAVQSAGQRYKLTNGQEVQRADLATLYDQKSRLEAELANQARGGGGYVRVGFRQAR